MWNFFNSIRIIGASNAGMLKLNASLRFFFFPRSPCFSSFFVVMIKRAERVWFIGEINLGEARFSMHAAILLHAALTYLHVNNCDTRDTRVSISAMLSISRARKRSRVQENKPAELFSGAIIAVPRHYHIALCHFTLTAEQSRMETQRFRTIKGQKAEKEEDRRERERVQEKSRRLCNYQGCSQDLTCAQSGTNGSALRQFLLKGGSLVGERARREWFRHC